jgi:hypothetical protein
MFREIVAPLVMSFISAVLFAAVLALAGYGFWHIHLEERFNQEGIAITGAITNITAHYTSGGRWGVGSNEWRCAVEYDVAGRSYSQFNIDGVHCEPPSLTANSGAYVGQLVTIIYLPDDPSLVTASPEITGDMAYVQLCFAAALALALIKLLHWTYDLWIIRLANRRYMQPLHALIVQNDRRGVMALLTGISPQLRPTNIGAKAAMFIAQQSTDIQQQFIDWYAPICLKAYKKSDADNSLLLSMSVSFYANPAFHLAFLAKVQPSLNLNEIKNVLLRLHIQVVIQDYDANRLSSHDALIKLEQHITSNSILLGDTTIEIDTPMRLNALFELIKRPSSGAEERPYEWLVGLSNLIANQPIASVGYYANLRRKKRQYYNSFWRFSLEQQHKEIERAAAQENKLTTLRKKILKQFNQVLVDQGVDVAPFSPKS